MGIIDAESPEGQKRIIEELRKENGQLMREAGELRKLIEIIFATKKIIDKAAGIIERPGFRTFDARDVYFPESV